MGILAKDEKQHLQSLKFDPARISGIELIEKELYNSLSDSKGVIRKMCSHILSAGGKRIRPLLVLYCGLVFSEEYDLLIKAAVSAELIHMASLIHDDIIDNSSLRRNKPSINKTWGTQFAVLCGDYLFAKAFGILSGNRLLKSMDYMVRAIQSMCHGEIIQANNRFNCGTDLKKYYEIIEKKTAVFLECCCMSGASLSDANEFQMKLIGQYGLNLGLAFQIVDDILDLCGKVDFMGKPRCEDLLQGNITLPVILMLKDNRYGHWVREKIENRELSESVTNDIICILKGSNIISKSFEIAASHINKAKQSVKLLPESQYTIFLEEMADMLQARMN